MSAQLESRDSAYSITSQLLFGLLFGNLLAILAVIAFRPFDPADYQSHLVLLIGALSLVSAALLFLAATMRRRTFWWWGIAVALDAVQFMRLLLAIVILAAWEPQGEPPRMVWLFVFVPFVGILAALGVVMTLRELRKGRRRRLSHAA